MHPFFKPFAVAGAIDSNHLAEHVRPVNDSGILVSLVLREDVSSLNCYTGETVFTGVCESPVKGLPVCTVFLTCELVTVYIKLAVVDKVPISKVSVLLRNDLAGDVMWPCPMNLPQPTSENNTRELEPEYPSLLTACAVTRN